MKSSQTFAGQILSVIATCPLADIVTIQCPNQESFRQKHKMYQITNNPVLHENKLVTNS